MVKDTKKIKIYSITANEIFERCFVKAGILNDGKLEKKNWSHTIKNEVAGYLGKNNDPKTYNNYLRDKFNLAQKNIRYGALKELIGFYPDKLQPLLTYLEIPDIIRFNDEFESYETNIIETVDDDIDPVDVEPIAIHVLYSPSVLGRFDILRSPDRGVIYVYPNGDLIYEGEKDLYIKNANLQQPALQEMFGQQAPWIKAQFVKDGHVRSAYFVEFYPEQGIIAHDPEELLTLLSPRQI